MRENVSNVKEEKDQTTRPCHDSPSVSSVFETKRRKFMAYCGVGPLIAAKFKKFKWLKPHKSVNNNKKLKITPVYQFTLLIFLLLMFALANTAGCVVAFLALLIVVLCRMFSHHVCLELIRSAALEVAVSTGKRLLTSVRSHVSF